MSGIKKDVAVVIPVYKTHLSAYERIGLQQCKAILSGYDIIFAKPGSLDISGIINGSSFTAVSFNDRYFESVHGYNELMMTEMFYKSFADYEHILIYQLDAFVFSDQLDFWCGQGYDYIGAPWLRLKPYKNVFDKVFTRVKNYLHLRYNIKYDDGMPKIGKQMEEKVGNGGLSLRRVSKFTACCVQYKPLIDYYVAFRHPWFNEDIFWSIELNRKKQCIKIPAYKKAVRFAIETNPGRGLKLNNGELPFGCHAWDKNTDFWRPVFKKYGYDI